MALLNLKELVRSPTAHLRTSGLANGGPLMVRSGKGGLLRVPLLTITLSLDWIIRALRGWPLEVHLFLVHIVTI